MLPQKTITQSSQPKQLKVLFVDDQTVLLNAVERVVRRQAKNWNIRLANSGIEAIQFLKNLPFDVVVSDMRMPEMDGIDLLDYVRQNHPNIIRIILSGYSRDDRTIKAVRVAHQYFIKPYSTQSLIDALELTHTLYKRIRNPGLQGLIASIDRLPTPRKVFYEIHEAVNNPDTTVEDIAAIIVKDTAVTGKILQVVNSAFFGQSSHIESIEHAVKVLGVESIRSLILIAGIASDHKEMLNGIISIDLYSHHCIEVANICKSIAVRLKLELAERETLFTIGLLHDVGKLVLLKKYAEIYTENGWQENPYTTKVHISQIEKMGEEHSCIGAALIALWGLPPIIVNAIASYENPFELGGIEARDSMILHLADAISNYQHGNKSSPILETNDITRGVVETLMSKDQFNSLLQQLFN